MAIQYTRRRACGCGGEYFPTGEIDHSKRVDRIIHRCTGCRTREGFPFAYPVITDFPPHDWPANDAERDARRIG